MEEKGIKKDCIKKVLKKRQNKVEEKGGIEDQIKKMGKDRWKWNM